MGAVSYHLPSCLEEEVVVEVDYRPFLVEEVVEVGDFQMLGVEEYSFMHTSVHIVRFGLLFPLILPIPQHFFGAAPVQTFYPLTIATAHL